MKNISYWDWITLAWNNNFGILNYLLGDSSSKFSVTGGVVTVDDDWWCEWWLLWCESMRCVWWWCEWECALFELVELVKGCGGGGSPCDFVIVNSPLDVVNLWIKFQQIISFFVFQILIFSYGTLFDDNISAKISTNKSVNAIDLEFVKEKISFLKGNWWKMY